MSGRRWLDAVWLLAIGSAGALAWRSGCERAESEATYARLAAAAGGLDVVDPSRIYARAIPTGQPLCFAWRYYSPPGPSSLFSGTPWGSLGGGTTASFRPVRDGMLKINFRERENGDGFELTVLADDSTEMRVFGDRSVVDLLRGRRDRIEVEQAATTATVSVAAGEPLTLLRFRLPPDIVAEGWSKPSGLARSVSADFYEFTINPPASGR